MCVRTVLSTSGVWKSVVGPECGSMGLLLWPYSVADRFGSLGDGTCVDDHLGLWTRMKMSGAGIGADISEPGLSPLRESDCTSDGSTQNGF